MEEEARGQKVVDDAAEQDAVDSRSARTQSRTESRTQRERARVARWAADAALEEGEIARTEAAEDAALQTTEGEQARNRQEAASKKAAEHKAMVDAHRLAAQTWAEEHPRRCAQAREAQAAYFAERRELGEDEAEAKAEAEAEAEAEAKADADPE